MNIYSFDLLLIAFIIYAAEAINMKQKIPYIIQ